MAEVRVTDITPPHALLRLVDRDSVEYLELVESIRDHGLLQPVLVRKRRGRWELIDGLHRYTAVRELGLETIECRPVSATDEEALILALQANAITKETLPCEYAAHLRRYLKLHTDLTIAGLSRIVKKSPTWIGNCLALNHLDEQTQTMINRGEIPLQSAYMLAKIPRHLRPDFVDRARSMAANEFKLVAAEAIRRWREDVCYGRQQTYFPDEFKVRQYLRTLREVREEHKTTNAGIEVLQRQGCQSALEGWRAAVKWMLHIDPQSIEVQRRLHESKRRGDVCRPIHDQKSFQRNT